MSLTLYYHPLSSYCHKVLIALYEAGTPFERRIIDLGDPAQRAELGAHWPFAKFPVIHDGERALSLPESTIIIEYLDRHFPGPRPLLPADADEALAVRLWDRILDQYVHTPMQQIVADRIHGANGDLSGQRALLDTAYTLINRQIADRAWLSHAEFSLADCAATPALFYASLLQPIPDGLRHLHGYFERLLARPSVRRTLEEAKPYFEFFPFAERIPTRYR